MDSKNTVKHIESHAELAEFWQHFERNLDNPLDSFAWFSAAATAFAPGDPLEAYAAAADDGSCSVAAFVVSHRLGIKRNLAPGEWLGEPFDLPNTGEAALRLLVNRLSHSRRPIRLMRLYADSTTLRMLQTATQRRGHLKITSAGTDPVLILDSTQEESDRRLNSGRRSDLRRARRRAEKLGGIETNIISPSVGDAEAVLEHAFSVEGSGWKTRQGSSILSNKKYTAFFTAYCVQAAAKGELRIALLKIGGVTAASQIAIERGRAFWVLKVGYDPDFASCSPGILLMQETIKYAASRKLERFEMLGSMERWIAMWQPVLRDTVTVYFYPNSVAGLAARSADSLKPALAAMQSFYRRARDAAIARIMPRFIIGSHAEDAIELARETATNGYSATVGYWHSNNDPKEVEGATAEYLRLIDLLRNAAPAIRHLSIKLPSIGFKKDVLERIAKNAQQANITLHCDSHSPEEADHMREIVEYFSGKDLCLGYTIPARWGRSTDDAKWACSKHLTVRVVKGQWPDLDNDPADLRTAYLNIIDTLCFNHAAYVCVATHDTPLVKEAVRRLRAANIPCHLELLYGLPTRRSLAQAKKLALNVRLYVPYGTSYLPYSVWKAIKNPRLLFWIIRGWLHLA